jgi:hypothetical protein
MISGNILNPYPSFQLTFVTVALSTILAHGYTSPTSLADFIIADRTFSLLITAQTARVCVTEKAGTNQIGLFKPASNCEIKLVLSTKAGNLHTPLAQYADTTSS